MTGCQTWVTNRIPDPLKQHLRENQSLEFYWADGEEDGDGEQHGVLTHVLDTHYESPKGVCAFCVYVLMWE